MSKTTAIRKAEELLVELGIRAAPVDVERVARELGLRVIVKSFPDDDVSGLLVRTPGESYICVQATNSRVRRRFTIAHEIGHYRLNHTDAEGVHVDRGYWVKARDAKASQGTDNDEIEANAFAAALLMPKALIDLELPSGRGLRDDDVERLAKKFDVSQAAMGFRLQDLHYLAPGW